MGRPIVYCGMCGKSLKEDDFSKGRAHVVDNSSFCVTCRIVPQPLQAPPRPTPLPSSTSTVIGVTVAIVLAVVALAALLLTSGRTPAPPPPPRRVAELPSVPAEAARAAIQNLEAFASTSADPDAVLERCQATRSTL